MPAEKHEHRPGEPRENCVNCQLIEMEAEMSGFEKAMLNWFLMFSNRFCLEAGITQAEWQQLEFETNQDKQIAIKILKILDDTVRRIAADKAGEKNG